MFILTTELFSDLSTECPPGMIMDQCGSLCQETCDDVNGGGIKACPLICGPAACVCPYGLVRYRDRCVDPKECYSLEKCKPQLFWLLRSVALLAILFCYRSTKHISPAICGELVVEVTMGIAYTIIDIYRELILGCCN